MAEARADQGDVWDRISERAAMLGAHAPTRAMHDIYEARRADIDAFVTRLAAVDGQAGAAFAIDGVLAGVEMFDAPATLSRLLPKIVSSYALEAVAAAEAPLAAAVCAVAAALAVGDRLVHFVGFPLSADPVSAIRPAPPAPSAPAPRA